MLQHSLAVRTYRTIAFAAGLFALVLQYGLVASREPNILTWTVNFFSFFTILTNTLGALALILPVVAPHSAPGRFFDRPGVRTAIAGYFIIVAGVYVMVLRHTLNLQGPDKLADQMLHYLMPALFLADWLLYVPKGLARWRDGFGALIFPLCFSAWTLLHGAAANWYPYPFMDAGKLGYATVLLNIAGLTAIFLIVVACLAGLDRVIARLRS